MISVDFSKQPDLEGKIINRETSCIFIPLKCRRGRWKWKSNWKSVRFTSRKELSNIPAGFSKDSDIWYITLPLRMLTKRWYSIKRKIQPTPFLRSIEGASAISANHQHHSLRSDIFYLNDNYGASLDSKQKMGNKSPRNGQSAGKLKTQHKMCLTQCKTNLRQLWMWTQTNNKRSLYTKIHHNTS